MDLSRLSGTKAIIAGVATIVTIGLSYTSLSIVLDIPDNMSGLANYLSIPALIALVLLLLLNSDFFLRRKRLGTISVMGFLFVGLSTAFGAEYLITEHSHKVSNCRHVDDTYVLAPFRMTEGLLEEIDDGGGGVVSDAWCSHEDRTLFQENFLKEANTSVLILSLLILLSQVLLTYAIIVAAWLVANEQTTN